MQKDDIYIHDESTGTTPEEEKLSVSEHSRKYRSKWNCDKIKGPLWPTEGFSRGNDVYLFLFLLCLIWQNVCGLV